jgi:hypothetical protein
VSFSFVEDCVHILEWYVVDNLGIESDYYFQEYHVDVTPPSSYKEVGECSYLGGNTSSDIVDIAFVVDTSASMDGEWAVMDAVLSGIIDDIVASGTNLSVTIYGINDNKGAGYPNIGAYSQLMDITYYAGALQAQVPANHDDREDWGPGTSWAALYHPWRAGAVRVVIPISDEFPYNGNGDGPDDAQSIVEAIGHCNNNSVTVYGFYSAGFTVPIQNYMIALSEGTGGQAYYFDQNNADDFATKFEGILAFVTTSYVSLSTPLTFTASDVNSSCASGFSHYEYRVSYDADLNLRIEGNEKEVNC